MSSSRWIVWARWMVLGWRRFLETEVTGLDRVSATFNFLFIYLCLLLWIWCVVYVYFVLL